MTGSPNEAEMVGKEMCREVFNMMVIHKQVSYPAILELVILTRYLSSSAT